MNVQIIRTFVLLLLLGTIYSNVIISQVTIGSNTEPKSGALLDLKEDNETTRGLGLPRVNLASKKSLEPCLTAEDSADETERKKHVGLIVYNVGTEVETTKEDRFCNGLHVWDGEIWQPLIPYFDPDNNRWERKEDLVIKRGPGDSEVTTYTTTYFHGYSRFTASSGIPTSGSVYVCDKSKLKEIDAGQWMTMNLRTEYQPDGARIQTWGEIGGDRHRIGQREIPKNPAGLDAREVELNGLLYNWAAATNNRDPDLALDTEWKSGNPRIQGICPAGWHLPDIKEWEELTWILRAQYYQFGSSTNWVTSVTSTLHGGASISPEQGGMDWRKVGARWNGLKPTGIENYGKAGYFWSSTAAETTRDPIHHGDKDKWEGRGYNATNGVILTGLNMNVIATNSEKSYRSRVLMESVRCKKD